MSSFINYFFHLINSNTYVCVCRKILLILNSSSQLFLMNFFTRVFFSAAHCTWTFVAITFAKRPFRYPSVMFSTMWWSSQSHRVHTGYSFRQVGPSKWRHGERCKTKRFLLPFMACAGETSIISSRYFCHEDTRWTRWLRAMFNTFPVDAPRVWRFCLMHNAHASSLRPPRF